MSNRSAESVNELLERWCGGDQEALSLLVPFFERELRRLSKAYVHEFHPGDDEESEAEDVVQDAYVRLIERKPPAHNRTEFLAVASRVIRNLLVVYARAKVEMSDEPAAKNRSMNLPKSAEEDLIALHEGMDRLARIAPRKSRVVELRYFGGLTINETAEFLNISPSTVERDWTTARGWLRKELDAGPFIESAPVFEHVPFDRSLSDDEFFALCQENRDLRIERTKEGELIIMPPTGGETGIRNARLISKFAAWSETDGSGQVFDSSTGFKLSNSAVRSPDLSWVTNSRWAELSSEDKEKFPPLCPDFVVEIRSRTDSLTTLQEKMEEYIAYGAQLGWLIDSADRRVHVYRAGADVEILDDPETILGEPLLKGFVLDVRSLWN